MKKTTKFTSLKIIFAIAFLALLVYQALWQIYGHKNPSFVKFMRQYNRRPDASGKTVMRGSILDCNGKVLARTSKSNIWSRVYPLGAAASHPVGYYHPKYGITAVERVCDAPLSGMDNALKVKSFDDLRRFVADSTRPETGKTVKLTINSDIQLAAYAALKGRKGAAVVMIPSTGKILALASSPGFDPGNPHLAFSNSQKPIFNRAVQGTYPPGSTFKLAVAALACDAKIKPSLFCPGGGYVPGPGTPPIRDSEYYECLRKGEKWGGWGALSLHEAIVHSSNVYFSQLGVEKIGVDRFAELSHRAQVGKTLPYFSCASGSLETAPGNFPVVRKKAGLGALSIGQGELLLTPLHVAAITAGIANSGVIMTPQLNYSEKPTRLSRLCSKEAAATVAAAMADVVESGTGRGISKYAANVCGKTGTAQTGRGADHKDHSWFTCFAPRGKPKVCVTVLIESGGFGAQAALPAAGEILKACKKAGCL